MNQHPVKTSALVVLIHFLVTGILAYWGLFNFAGNVFDSNETTEKNERIATVALSIWSPPVMVRWNAYWKEKVDVEVKEKTEFSTLVYQQIGISFLFSFLIGAGTLFALKKGRYKQPAQVNPCKPPENPRTI